MFSIYLFVRKTQKHIMRKMLTWDTRKSERMKGKTEHAANFN
jgi:hypothetical protein